MSNLILIEVMQSTWDAKYWALSIDGTRCGPDAGPWDVHKSFSVPIDDLERIISEWKNRDLNEPTQGRE